VTIDLAHPRRLGAGDALVRALGWKRGVVGVVDATAGLGRDAAALARVGFRVLAVERSPAVAALWREALPRAPRGLSFVERDAKDLLRELAAAGSRPDAVYVDPMYPAGKRKAASQKALVQLRELVGDDADVDALLAVALEVAAKRVVVKRPKKAPALRPSVAHSWVCASTRYDLYLVR
jgi:16S rRNA (guanine1516-N2)-methyltransferase